MKAKIIVLVFMLFLFEKLMAQQVSFKSRLMTSYETNKLSDVRSGKLTFKDLFDEYNKRIGLLPSFLNDTVLKVAANPTLSITAKRNKVRALQNKIIDSIEYLVSASHDLIDFQNENLKIGANVDKKDRIKKSKLKSPYKEWFNYSKAFQSQRFFENDSNHVELFQNSTVNYSPKNRQMSLYTEVINDYFGPVRVGAGFQLSPKSNQDNVDSAAKKRIAKNDLVSQLQNTGAGTFSVNFSYPLMENKNTLGTVNYRVFLYENTGISFDTLGVANTNFIVNADAGLRFDLFTKGFTNKITAFAQTKVSYYWGNQRFREVLQQSNASYPPSFFLAKTSIGLSFLDKYRVAVDIFPHFGNSFVKENFATAFTFTLRQ